MAVEIEEAGPVDKQKVDTGDRLSVVRQRAAFKVQSSNHGSNGGEGGAISLV